MKILERSPQPPGRGASHDVLIALTMAIALALLTGLQISAWMRSGW